MYHLDAIWKIEREERIPKLQLNKLIEYFIYEVKAIFILYG